MMWRFAVASDPAVDRFIIRDADGRLSERDAESVAFWIQSCETFHVVRDHPHHGKKPVGMCVCVRVYMYVCVVFER